MTEPLRIGVLGCANIAKQFVRDVAESPAVRIVAVASRDAAKAAAFADTFGIATRHASYEALLADPTVEAIYIPLPNTMHGEWSIKAAEAGKHVLCEKPLALSAKEAEAMFAAARKAGVMLLESYPYWFQPQTRDTLALVEGGEDAVIGPIRSIQASFGFQVGNPQTNIRLKPELGGGALLDAGCYPLSLIQLAMGEAPARVFAEATWTEAGVDISISALLTYADGRRVQMSCGMDGANHRRAMIVGARGTVETEFLNHTSETTDHPYGYLPSELRVRRGIPNTVPFEAITSPTGSGFRFAAEAFAEMVAKKDTAMMARYAKASVDIAATLNAIAKSARAGKPVAIG
jgi:predicted dehydrogenase